MVGRTPKNSTPAKSKNGADGEVTPSRRSSSRTAAIEPKKQKIQYEDLELTDSDEDEAAEEIQPATKAVADKRGRGKTNSKTKQNSDDDDDDEEEEDDEDDEDDYEENEPPKKKKATGKKGGGSSVGKAPAKKAGGGGRKKKPSVDEEDEDEDDEEHDEESEPSDGEDENEDVDASSKVTYKDDDWFEKVTKTCQVCKKSFDTCRDASLCVTGKHRRLRCYLCYNYYRNTETLFRHYQSNHRASNCKKEQLLCPFCSQSIPFKSTSCHVITTHIAPREAAQQKGDIASFSFSKQEPMEEKKGKRKSKGRGKNEDSEEEDDDDDEEDEDEDEEDDDEEDEEEGEEDDEEEEDEEEDKKSNGTKK